MQSDSLVLIQYQRLWYFILESFPLKSSAKESCISVVIEIVSSDFSDFSTSFSLACL